MPVPIRHGGRQNRRKHHRPCDGNTVRRRQIAGVFKADNHNHHGNVKQPVNERNVDLTGFHLRGMDNAHRRQIPQANRLTRQREHPRDHRLRRDNGRQRGDNQHRHQRPVGRQQEERVLDSLRVFQQQRTLTEVIQYQRRQHDGKPREANRQLPEVTHIRVQRFDAGNREHDRAEGNKRNGFVFQEEMNRPCRVKSLQHFWIANNSAQTQCRQDQEPGQHNRCKQLTDKPGAMFLNRKQQGQDNNGERNHPRLQLRRDNLQPLDCRKHRNRRRNHHFPIEEAATYQPDDHQERGHSCRRVTPRQGHQRQDPAFTGVIRAHDEREIFKRDHQNQQPEDE